MKQLANTVLIIILTAAIAGTASADRRARKLPVDAYIKSAKIDIISGDLERYPEAIAMLDSLFMHYGPHAEGLHWMGQIMVDYVEKSPSPMEKKPHIEKLVAYRDSLHMCCDNEEIKKKYRKNCEKYIRHSDSIGVLYWREFYNAGVEQLGVMDEINNEIVQASDSASRSYLENNLRANMDSCVGNMELAIKLDPNNHQAYIGIGSAYEKGGEFDKALEWQEKGMEKAPEENRATMSLSLGYTFIKNDRYCDAIPYLRTYLEDSTTDITWMYNLSICFNNCGMYDSARVLYDDILALDPGHKSALSGIGRYYNELARRASDSANTYSATGNEAGKADWTVRKNEAFDSSHAYYKRAFQSYTNGMDPNELSDAVFVADQYALVSALREKYEDAIEGYIQLTEWQPDNHLNWTYLGDVKLRQTQLEDAIAAYEKSVELQPNQLEIWQNLIDLYREQGMTAKEAEAKKKVEELKQSGS